MRRGHRGARKERLGPQGLNPLVCVCVCVSFCGHPLWTPYVGLFCNLLGVPLISSIVLGCNIRLQPSVRGTAPTPPLPVVWSLLKGTPRSFRKTSPDHPSRLGPRPLRRNRGACPKAMGQTARWPRPCGGKLSQVSLCCGFLGCFVGLLVCRGFWSASFVMLLLFSWPPGSCPPQIDYQNTKVPHLLGRRFRALPKTPLI